jgi:hypothetical protein
MKRPSPASLKRVTAENLAQLGTARLAEILLEVADTRVELKRRLRMELAAEQGAEHLLPEIDRRLTLLANSRGAVSWRQRPAFIRDLDGVRGLIAGRLAALDLAAAQDRILTFLQLAPHAHLRLRDKDGGLEAVFARAAVDAVTMWAQLSPSDGGGRLAEAILSQPVAWGRWGDTALGEANVSLAQAALAGLDGRTGHAFRPVLRSLADVAQDPDAFSVTFTPQEVRTPVAAAQIAARLLRAGRLDETREILEGAVEPGLVRRARGGHPTPDFEWESVWIDYLDAAGRTADAQAARWAAFERTLSTQRVRDYTRRLPDFEDVEAEDRIFGIAAKFPDADVALQFLMRWPALPAASSLIEARSEDLRLDPEMAEAFARKLRKRFPASSKRLLRSAAAAAFRRREFKICDRLTEEADSIAP